MRRRTKKLGSAPPRQAARATQPDGGDIAGAAPQATAEAVAAAVATLIELQDDYRAWLDTLPANLEGSRLAEKLQAFVELDLDELQAIEPPRGCGRDRQKEELLTRSHD